MIRPRIIVVGASAGGVEALEALVAGLPHNLPAAMFVVLHTAIVNSHLPEILSRNGNMAAAHALSGSTIVNGRIYVARPNLHLTLEEGRMWLTAGPSVNRHRPAIDPLFVSAAEAYGSRVIGVLLTGYQDDGTAGLAAIKNHGGIAIVQDPDEAFAPDMPRSAVRLVQVDHCLPVKEIAPLLVDLVEGPHRKTGKSKNRK